MKLYILSTLCSNNFKTGIEELTKDAVYITSPQKLSNIEELKSEDEKVLVIDPDFVDWEITRSDLESVTNLKAVLVSSTSFSWVDQTYLNENNIPLINVKDWCTQAVAEYAIMMALNLARKMALLIKDDFALDYNKYCGVQLKGKTAGIIGMGNIGSAIAERAKGLGMNVIYWSKNSTTDLGTKVELEEIFKDADFVFPTMADNSEVQKLITDELLKTLKPSSFFISIVHRYYNHELLIEMVKNNQLAGYAFEDGKTKITDYQGNIWTAPEYAWCTSESLENNDKKLLENVRYTINNGN